MELKSLYLEFHFYLNLIGFLEFNGIGQVETVTTFQNFVTTIIKQYQLKLGTTYKFSIATLKMEQGMKVCHDNK